MFKHMRLVMIAGMLALTGCTGNVCARAERVYSDLTDKVRPCESQGFSVNQIDVAQCEERLAKCSDADMKVADEFLDCMDELGTCQPENTKPFTDALQACVEQHKASAGCNPY